jgi:hypothetical protein
MIGAPFGFPISLFLVPGMEHKRWILEQLPGMGVMLSPEGISVHGR